MNMLEIVDLQEQQDFLEAEEFEELVDMPLVRQPAVRDRRVTHLHTVGDAEFKKQLETRVTGTVLRSSPAEFAREYQEEARVWQRLFNTLNLKPE